MAAPFPGRLPNGCAHAHLAVDRRARRVRNKAGDLAHPAICRECGALRRLRCGGQTCHLDRRGRCWGPEVMVFTRRLDIEKTT